MSERVRVVVRIRPFIPSDPADAELNTIVLDDTHLSVGNNRVFKVDRVFMMEDESEDIYRESVAPLVDRFLGGCNASVLAYGQTGTGKTYTVQSILPLLLTQVLESSALREFAASSTSAQPLLHLQYVEVYGETIRDLLEDPSTRLDPTKQNKVRLVTTTSAVATDADSATLFKRETHTGCVVAGAARKAVNSIHEAAQLISLGDARRATGATNVHEHSSRSHAILSLFHPRYACRLDVVDLAGSEREKKTGNTGLRFQESIAINTGLLALGNVIRALSRNHRAAQGRGSSAAHKTTLGSPPNAMSNAAAPRAELALGQHVPYRSSKLTRLLQDTLGGSSATLFVACVAPDTYNRDETLRTLQYCSLALQVLNEPIRQYDRLQRAQSRERRRSPGRRTASGHSPTSPLGGSDEDDSYENAEKQRAFSCRTTDGTEASAAELSRQVAELQSAYAVLQQQYDEQGEVLTSICESYAEAKERLEVWERELRTDESLFTRQMRVMQQLMQENQKLRHRLVRSKRGVESAAAAAVLPTQVGAQRYRDGGAGVLTLRQDNEKGVVHTQHVHDDAAALLRALLERHEALMPGAAAGKDHQISSDSAALSGFEEQTRSTADPAGAGASGPPPVSALSPYRHLSFKSGTSLPDSGEYDKSNPRGLGAGDATALSTTTSEPVQSFIRSMLRQHGIFTGREKSAVQEERVKLDVSGAAAMSPPPTAQPQMTGQDQFSPPCDLVNRRAATPSAALASQTEEKLREDQHNQQVNDAPPEKQTTTGSAAANGSASLPSVALDRNMAERDVQLLQLAHEVLRYEETNTDLRNQVRLLQAKLDDKARETARLRLEVQDLKDVYSSLSAMTE